VCISYGLLTEAVSNIGESQLKYVITTHTHTNTHRWLSTFLSYASFSNPLFSSLTYVKLIFLQFPYGLCTYLCPALSIIICFIHWINTTIYSSCPLFKERAYSYSLAHAVLLIPYPNRLDNDSYYSRPFLRLMSCLDWCHSP